MLTLYIRAFYAVGFPNIEEIEEDLKPLMQKKIKKDKETLQLFVRLCGDEPMLSQEMFNEEFWEKCRVL